MTQEALKMALDALETELSIDWTNNDEFNASAEKMYEAIAAIKEALAQQEKDYERGFVDGMQKQMQSSVDKAVNRMAQPEQELTNIERHETNIQKFLGAPQQPEQEPVAWRTFDGEGGYDYLSYEDNESYADEWDKRNPNHKGWVDKLYTHSQPEQEYESVLIDGVAYTIPSKVAVEILGLHLDLLQLKQEQEPVADDFFRMIADRNPKPFSSLQRTWVNLTDEDCKGMSAGDKVIAMWANRILKEKNT